MNITITRLIDITPQEIKTRASKIEGFDTEKLNGYEPQRQAIRELIQAERASMAWAGVAVQLGEALRRIEKLLDAKSLDGQAVAEMCATVCTTLLKIRDTAHRALANQSQEKTES